MKVIEFAGMPRSGKTTAVEVMEGFLKREGKRIRVVYEGARISPLDKSDRYNYNAWSFHNTVNRILEARLDGYDFILVDRGVLDHVAFLEAISPECSDNDISVAQKYYLGFLGIQDLEILFDVSPEEAIRREGKNKPFLGRVFSVPFLQSLRHSYASAVKTAEDTGRKIIRVDGGLSFEDNLEKMVSLTRRLCSYD